MGSRKNSDAPHKMPILEQNLRDLQGDMRNSDFAKKLDVTRQSLEAWIGGWKVPDLPMLEKIAEKTGKSIDWLIGREDHDISTADFDYRMMQKHTGLSEDAIEKLTELHRRENDSSDDPMGMILASIIREQYKLDVLNRIIEHDSFSSLVRSLNHLVNPLSKLEALNEKGRELLSKETRERGEIAEILSYPIDERNLKADYYEIIDLFIEILSDVSGYKRVRAEYESIRNALFQIGFENDKEDK